MRWWFSLLCNKISNRLVFKIAIIFFQVGDFLLLHLLGQNMSMRVFGEVLDELSRRLHLGSNAPSAPSTLEMAPIYPNIEKYAKETET